MSRRIKQSYDAGILWITTKKCNFHCSYCLCSEIRNDANSLEINIPALMRTLDDSKRTFLIVFTGGEPFLIPNIIEACSTITKNHYIAFTTNLVSKKIKEFAEKIDPEKVRSIIASTHIEEMKRLNLIDTFVDNFLLCKEKGFRIIPNVVAYPQLLKNVQEYKTFFQKKGIKLNFVKFVGEFNGKTYPDSYSEKDIKKFGLNKTKLKWIYTKGKLCNAGYNICSAVPDGNVNICNKINKSIGNIYNKIEFNSKLIKCPLEICACPLSILDQHLYRKAIQENNINSAIPQFFRNYILYDSIIGKNNKTDSNNFLQRIITFLTKFIFFTRLKDFLQKLIIVFYSKRFLIHMHEMVYLHPYLLKYSQKL